MGLSCPVCETPQVDAVHLANHLAFTAIARGGPHEDWLSETVPGWADLGEAALADRVADYADTVDYPQVFEDTTDKASADRSRPTAVDSHVPDDDKLAAVLEAARELTRRRREDSETE